MTALPSTEEQLADYIYSIQNWTDAKEVAAHLWPALAPRSAVQSGDARIQFLAKVMASARVGDPNATDITGEPRWKWFIEDATRYLKFNPNVFAEVCGGVAQPAVQSDCPIGVKNPINCSAGSCQRCSDFRDGWNSSRVAQASTEPFDVMATIDPDYADSFGPRCQNCGDPISDALHAAGFCGMCREMGCTVPSAEGK